MVSVYVDYLQLWYDSYLDGSYADPRLKDIWYLYCQVIPQ